MSLNRKFRACSITFLLIFSTLSFFVIIPENVKAQGYDEEYMDDILRVELHRPC